MSILKDEDGYEYAHIPTKISIEKYDEVLSDLTALINKYSLENGSNTPDYILAEYLINCLINYDNAVRYRDTFHETEVILDISQSYGREKDAGETRE